MRRCLALPQAVQLGQTSDKSSKAALCKHSPVTQTEVKPLRSRRLCSSATVEEGSMHTGCTTKPGVWFLAVLTCV